MAIDLQGIANWLHGWFPYHSEVVAKDQTSANASKNMVTDSSGQVTTENKVSVGTGLSFDSNVANKINHSNNVSALTTSSLKKIKYDAQGHITETANVTGSDLPSHSHNLDNVTDDQIYSYIEPTGSTIRATFSAIDSALYDLGTIRAIEVVSSLPTASSSTIGKLYIINENSKVNVYYTEQNGSSYSWHKMDTDILDELSISWNDITNKPSTFTPSSHSHSISDVNNLQTSLDGKAPTSHASSETTYGVGTTSNYGHNKIRDNLTASTLVNGESLSAHQGYILKGLIDDLEDTIVSFDASNIDFEPSSYIWGEYVQVVNTVAQGLDRLKEISNGLNATLINKQDNITSIVLVPKSTDANGKIIFYTGDEPT